jgi:hypothetical protein
MSYPQPTFVWGSSRVVGKSAEREMTNLAKMSASRIYLGADNRFRFRSAKRVCLLAREVLPFSPAYALAQGFQIASTSAFMARLAADGTQTQSNSGKMASSSIFPYRQRPGQ